MNEDDLSELILRSRQSGDSLGNIAGLELPDLELMMKRQSSANLSIADLLNEMKR